jgi:ketosteroid isomerase-like protein
MSEENVELVRRIHDELIHGADPLELGLMAPDFEYVSPPDAMEPGVQRGVEGMRRVLATLEEAYAERRFDVDRILDAGDRVVVLGRLTMVGRSSGVPLQGDGAQVWTLRDGLVARIEWFLTQAEALRAAGIEDET